MSRRFWKGLVVVFLLHALVFYIKVFSPWRIPDGLEEENFLIYTDSLLSGNFPHGLSFYDTRIFPGLPLILVILELSFHNYLLVVPLFAAVFLFLFYYSVFALTRNYWLAVAATLFPPVLWEITSKVSTESVTIPLLLIAYYWYFKKQQVIVPSLLTGFAAIVRPAALFCYLAFFLYCLAQKEWKKMFFSLSGFLIFPLALLVFNQYFFNDIFYQLNTYNRIDIAGFVPLKVFSTAPELVSAGALRAVVVGFVYMIFSVVLTVKVLRNTGDFLMDNDELFIKIWILSSLIFMLTIGPERILFEINRYLAVLFPVISIVLSKKYAIKNYFPLVILLSAAFVFV